MIKRIFILCCFTSFFFAQTYHLTQQSHVHGGTEYIKSNESINVDVTTTSGTFPTNIKYHAITVGQHVTGYASSNQYSTDLGIWAIYKKQPDAPVVKASDAGISTGIKISYAMDPLSPPQNLQQVPDDISTDELGGFGQVNQIQDGIVAVTKSEGGITSTALVSTYSYAMTPGNEYTWELDINPGVIYNFGVTAFNGYGMSPEGYDVGFSLANGYVEGVVNVPGSLPGTTGSGVQDVEIRMERGDGESIGHSLLLDGDDNYLYGENIYNDLLTDNKMSVEFWFKNPENSTTETIIDMGDLLTVSQTDNILSVDFDGLSITSNSNWDTNAWHHVAITKGNRGACIQNPEEYTESNGETGWQFGEEYIDANENYFYDIGGALPDIDSSELCIGDNNTWDDDYHASGINLYVDGIFQQGVSNNAVLAISNTFIVGNGYSGYIDDLRIWNHARTQDEILKNKDRFLSPQPSNNPQGVEEGLIGYWKMDAGMFDKTYNLILFSENVPNTQYFEDVGNDLSIIGINEDDSSVWSDDCPNQYISSFTSDVGFYTILNIAYDISNSIGTQFVVTPYKENHNFFDPGFRTLYLRLGNYDHQGINFIDNSLFAVTGNVYYQGYESCTIDSTEILVQYQGQQDFYPTSPPTYTDEDGAYRIDVEPEKTFAIKAKYKNHVFPNTYSFYDIGSDKPNQNFEDITTNTLYINVAGGICNGIDLGPYSISYSNGCSDPVLLEDISGTIYSIQSLPPIEYQVEIIPDNPNAQLSNDIQIANLDNYDPNDPNTPIDPPLPGQSGAALSYIHYPDLAVEIDSIYQRTEIDSDDPVYTLLSPSCGNDYIFDQGNHYSTMFEVKEKYSYLHQESGALYEGECSMDSFNLNVIDNVTNYSMGDDMLVDSGGEHVEYFFTARNPNIVGTLENTQENISQSGFKQYIQIKASDSDDDIGRTTSSNLYAYVNGTIADADQTGVNTSTSEIPLFVLRDPPGDASYSYLSEEQQVCQSISISNSNSDTYSVDNTLSLGADFSCNVGFSIFGATFSTELEVEATADIGAGFTSSVSNVNGNEISTCMTVSNTYSTSDSEDFIYGDGDIFVGSGLSMTFSQAIEQNTELNDQNECIVSQQQTYTYGMDGLVNTYMHTQSFIENTMIPQLEAQSNLDASFGEQADYWRELIELNETAKNEALPAVYDIGGSNGAIDDSEGSTLINWSAGSIYEFSKTSESAFSSVHEFEYANETELTQEMGLEVNGVGFGLGFAQIFSSAQGIGNSQEQVDAKTNGFVFADDDPGDNFLVEIKEDQVWGMPVYDLIGGQSECPWESQTVKRYDPILQVSDSGPDADNFGSILDIDGIAELDPAILTFKISNSSPTGEAKQYMLKLVNASNPLGALVTYNGQPMTAPISIDVDAPIIGDDGSFEPGTSMATIFVRKDSDSPEYYYEGLKFEMYPECSEGDPEQIDTVMVNVEFERPCTNISLNAPFFDDQWVINSSDDTLKVQIQDYEFADPLTNNNENLNDIFIEYAEFGTDDWIAFPDAIVELDVIDPADGNQLLYYNFYLDFASILSASQEQDGGSHYKLRAVTNCGEFNKSYSNVLEGIIDRNPPTVFQIEPADDVLSGPDEISLTYNESLDCNSIGFHNISTINTTSNTTYSNPSPTLNPTCIDNKITFTLDGTVAGYTVENDIISVSVSGIRDVFGNIDSVGTTWEFLYNQNPISWSQPIISADVYIGEDITISNRLNNIGGEPSDFIFGELNSIPSWLTIDPMSGWLNGQGDTEINFTLDPYIEMGHYSDIIYVENSLGHEPFQIDLNVLCRPPVWGFDISQYQYNMTVVAELAVEDVISDDTYDRIAATIDGQIRGFVQLENFDENTNLVYLTIYGNSEDEGKDISFRLWDNDNCRELWNIESSVPIIYSNYQYYGSFNSPIILNAADLSIAQFIGLDPGWSWISFNLSNEDMSLDNALSYLNPSYDDQIVDFNTSTFSEYSTSYENGSWLGTLDTINNQSMYQINIAETDTITLVGLEVENQNNQISYSNGWNWIAYTPQIIMEVDDALSNVSTNEIDFIKGRFGFAEYANDNIGWVGSLTHMHPGQGYMLKANADGHFYYANSSRSDFARSISFDNDNSNIQSDIFELYDDFDFDPSGYQHTMSMVAEIDNQNPFFDKHNIEDLYIILYIEDEVRGISDISSYDGIDKKLIFSTIFSNNTNDNIRIVIYDRLTGEEFFVNQELIFGINDILGSINAPIMLNTPDVLPENYGLSQNYPNPFNPITHIDYQIPEDSYVEISIYNVRGQVVANLYSGSMKAGYGQLVWDATNYSSGLYFVNMQASNYQMTRKMMLLK